MFATKRLSKELIKVPTQSTSESSPSFTLSGQSFAYTRRLDMIADRPPFQMKEHMPPGISIVKSENLEEWQMDIQVLDDNPLYQNQIYRLKFTFSSKYPIEPPEVQFTESKTSDTPRPIPIHPHIYSNGIICLDLLSSAGWSPVQTVESVCMSIQSMLTANSRNERPPGDSDFVSYNRRRPRDINFMYDDDNV